MSGVVLPNHIPPPEKCSYPIRAGNFVRPLIDGEIAFTRICETVEAAHKSVWITVAYIRADFRFPGSHGSFFDLLDRAAARGVDTRVIFWRTKPDELEHFHGHDAYHAFPA